jgi:NAD(P)-dependent dehydrogenase (short-subunit alcohol dehydrogenase family)
LALIDDVLNAWGRLDIWVCSSGILGPPSIEETTPTDLQKCFEANSMAPFFALKYAPPAMGKTTAKGNYLNAAPKDQKYGSIIVVSSTASTYGGRAFPKQGNLHEMGFSEICFVTLTNCLCVTKDAGAHATR